MQDLDNIKKAFDIAPAKMTKELNKAVKIIIDKIDNKSKREAPTNKQGGGGNLKQSIERRMTGIASGIVEVKSKYGVYVHEGTRPHIIRYTKPGRGGLYDKRTKTGFGRVVNHPGTIANPFMKRAIDAQQSFIDAQLKKAVDNALKL